MNKNNAPRLFNNEQWQRCLEHFFQHLYDKSESYQTFAGYRGVLTNFFRDPNKNPDAYSREDVEEFLHQPLVAKVSHNRSKTPAPATVGHRLAVIASFYHFCQEYTIAIPGQKHPQSILQCPSPCRGMSQGKQASAHRTLSEEELSQLFSVIPLHTPQGIRDRCLYITYLYTSRRRAEIARLRWSDIESTTFYEKGTPREGWRYRYKGKGKGKWEWAELAQEAKDAIDWYLIATGRIEEIQPDDMVFVRHHPGSAGSTPAQTTRPMAPSTILRTLKNYAIAAGLDEDKVCIHALRHTSAQLRYKSGQDALTIMRILGHASLGTTTIYLQSMVGESDIGAPLLAAKFGHLGGW